MKLGFACIPALVLAAATQAQPTPTYEEPYRPQFHFSPAINWTNDPNGLVYHAGECICSISTTRSATAGAT